MALFHRLWWNRWRDFLHLWVGFVDVDGLEIKYCALIVKVILGSRWRRKETYLSIMLSLHPAYCHSRCLCQIVLVNCTCTTCNLLCLEALCYKASFSQDPCPVSLACKLRVLQSIAFRQSTISVKTRVHVHILPAFPQEGIKAQTGLCICANTTCWYVYWIWMHTDRRTHDHVNQHVSWETRGEKKCKCSSLQVSDMPSTGGMNVRWWEKQKGAIKMQTRRWFTVRSLCVSSASRTSLGNNMLVRRRK